MSEHATRAKSALADTWIQVGKWAMVKGEKTVAKCITNGRPNYVRYDGEKRIGQFATFIEASRA
jgi:hypothetical protein